MLGSSSILCRTFEHTGSLLQSEVFWIPTQESLTSLGLGIPFPTLEDLLVGETPRARLLASGQAAAKTPTGRTVALELQGFGIFVSFRASE